MAKPKPKYSKSDYLPYANGVATIQIDGELIVIDTKPCFPGVGEEVVTIDPLTKHMVLAQVAVPMAVADPRRVVVTEPERINKCRIGVKTQILVGCVIGREGWSR